MNELKCKNCGAPLHSNKCEYCGTEYINNSIENYSDNIIERFETPEQYKLSDIVNEYRLNMLKQRVNDLKSDIQMRNLEDSIQASTFSYIQMRNLKDSIQTAVLKNGFPVLPDWYKG